MGQQHDQGGLAEQGRFTGHVGSGEDDDLLVLVVQVDVVGNIFLARGHQSLDHRMTTALDVEGQVLGHLRTAILILDRESRESSQDIDPGDYPAICLDRRDVLLNLGDKI